MKLTGQAYEDFEKWYGDVVMLQHKEYYTDIDYFTPSMQYGVYVDWFDSVGIYIEDKIDTDWDYKRITFYSDIDTNKEIYTTQSNEHQTRAEARSKAIEQANEIYNNDNK